MGCCGQGSERSRQQGTAGGKVRVGAPVSQHMSQLAGQQQERVRGGRAQRVGGEEGTGQLPPCPSREPRWGGARSARCSRGLASPELDGALLLDPELPSYRNPPANLGWERGCGLPGARCLPEFRCELAVAGGDPGGLGPAREVCLRASSFPAVWGEISRGACAPLPLLPWISRSPEPQLLLRNSRACPGSGC